MLTEQQLIAKLQTLKQVKPNQNWVVLAKNRILKSSAPAPVNPSVFATFSRVFYQKKLAYALAVFLFVFAGFFGFNALNTPAPEGSVVVKSNVQQLKLTSQSLASAVVGKQKNEIIVAAVEVKKATQDLTRAIVENPGVAKDIALEVKNNKTYLEILGDYDLKPASDMLYKAIVGPMIGDLKNTTLTDSQQKALVEIEKLYEQEEYAEAFEKILLIK